MEEVPFGLRVIGVFWYDGHTNFEREPIGGKPMSQEQCNHLEDIEGVVKWFDPRKGFGFITGPDEQDIFVHYSCIEGDGFRVLKDGASVVYSAIETDKGWKATHVKQADPDIVVMDRSRARTSRQ